MKAPQSIFCIATTIILSFAFQKSFSQSTNTRSKVSIVKLFTTNNETVKGILYAVNDSTVALYIENTAILKDNLLRDSLPLKIYSYRDIEKIKVRKRSAAAKGAIIGGGSGLIVGVLLDAAEQSSLQVGANLAAVFNGTDPEQIGFTPVFTITLGLIGTVSGALIGSIKKKIKIQGNKQLFVAGRNKLMKYSLKKDF
jgi:hypothetical protein